jgi:hypothetical protein
VEAEAGLMEEVIILVVAALALGVPAITAAVSILAEAGPTVAVAALRLAVPSLEVAGPAIMREDTTLEVPALLVAAPAIMEEVTTLGVAAIIVVMAAIIAEVIIMAEAATIGEVTTLAEDPIATVVTGVEVSGSALDGVGMDGGTRGGMPRTTRIMPHPLLLSNSNPRRMSSRSNRRRVTGIIATIQKVTTPMSRTVQAVG